MRFLLVCLILLFSGCEPQAESQAPVDAQPEWFSCHADADCVAEFGVCRQPTAVNKASLDLFRRWRDHINTMVDCAPVSETALPGTACRANRCQLIKGQ